MKARTTIVGKLTKDAENILTRKSQNKRCKFSVLVTLDKDKSIFVDCFLNTHLSEEKLHLFKKGTFCTFKGIYTEKLNEDKEKKKIYLNRTLHIKDFFLTNIKNPFYKNISIDMVGHLFMKPVYDGDVTILNISEKDIDTYGRDDNRVYICHLNYKLSDKVMKAIEEKDALIYISGYYNEDITPSFKSVYLERHIELKDFEMI